MKSRLYKVFPVIPRFNLFIGQSIYAIKVKLNRQTTINTLSTLKNIYANIGSGDAGLAEGWINLDFGDYPMVTHTFDCKKSLPFANDSAKAIYTEHFFEHLDYFTEVPYFLEHCYRSLQKGGVLRIIVPDAERYLIGYVQEGWDYLKKMRPLDDDLNDTLIGHQYETKMQLINEVFRQSGEHKFAWDFETMKVSLIKAGFTDIYKMSYNQSNDLRLVIDQAVRQSESLYVEAIK